jgi:hypothetical protein
MIDPLLELPAHLRERLARALDTGVLRPPYEPTAIRAALGAQVGVEDVCTALRHLQARGIAGPALALALDVATRAAARLPRPDLVWSGPPVPGVHARDTRRVYEELLASARRSMWVSTFAYYDGPR